MKKLIILLVVMFSSGAVYAQPVTPMGPIIDLNDSKFVEDMLVNAYIDRAARENYYDAIDGRFGGQKPLTYYVDIFYADKAKEEIQRQSGQADQMLNDSIQKENEIREKLSNLQGHYNASVDTINQLKTHLSWMNGKLAMCKKTRGKKC